MGETLALTFFRTTVLLVDDQAMIGDAVRRMLITEQDIDFHFCQDPTRAIKVAERIQPTVILQDLVMPEIDGFTLVRYFRANESTRHVPLIVLSSKEEPHTKAQAFALGANDYMVKLPDKVEVIARIRYHSRGYINMLERNEAYDALMESQKQLEIRNRFIRRTFGRYLSDDIVDRILESPQGLKLGGEKRTVSILMADLRGFTAISERLPPEIVVNLINNYLETMTEVIFKYRGTICDLIGDALLVVFGAPLMRPDDALRAVACAVEMQLAMHGVNVRNRRERYPEVAMGIGINTGEVVVGNIGSKKRTHYGVVGRNVNLTSRIESYTVGGQILVSQSTLDACGSILRVDDKVEVMPKGVKEYITLHEIGGIGGAFNLFIPEKKPIEFKDLPHPLALRFWVFADKYAATEAHKGVMVRAAAGAAEIHADLAPEKLSNLRISLFDDQGNAITAELYVKVVEVFQMEPPAAFRVHFTSVPPEARKFFEKVTG